MKKKIIAFLTPILTIAMHSDVAAQDMRLRAPIRTSAGNGMCLCPYDQIAYPSYRSQQLQFTEWESCEGISAYERGGGIVPSCYVGDRVAYMEGQEFEGRDFARLVEDWCRNQSRQVCFRDIFNRY